MALYKTSLPYLVDPLAPMCWMCDCVVEDVELTIDDVSGIEFKDVYVLPVYNENGKLPQWSNCWLHQSDCNSDSCLQQK